MAKRKNNSKPPLRIEFDGPLAEAISQCINDILVAFSALVVAVLLGIKEIVEAAKDRALRRIQKRRIQKQ